MKVDPRNGGFLNEVKIKHNNTLCKIILQELKIIYFNYSLPKTIQRLRIFNEHGEGKILFNLNQIISE